jgi:hypothetical protein
MLTLADVQRGNDSALMYDAAYKPQQNSSNHGSWGGWGVIVLVILFLMAGVFSLTLLVAVVVEAHVVVLVVTPSH